jgi:cytoskeleton protein RodZ
MNVLAPEIIAVAGENPGETLRRTREQNNWSQVDVAMKLNLTVQALGNLESGDFAKLPGNTFARGYIRTYAKLLGIDQEPLVVAFDQLTGSNAAGSSVHALGLIEAPTQVAQNLLRFVSFVLLAALALGSYLWWQDRPQRQAVTSSINTLEHVEVEGADGNTQIHPLDEPEDLAASAGQVTSELALIEIAPEIAAQPDAAAVITADNAGPITAAPGIVVDPATGLQNSAAVVAPTVAAVARPSESALVAESSPKPVAGEAIVGVQFSANCWVQLTDANGKVLFSALKRAGESLEVAGKPPLELRLGYARGAQVSFNGQNIDVAPYTSGETARIKLGL